MWKRIFGGTNRSGAPRAKAVPVELYTRRDCPLCDRMQSELERARPAVPYRLRVIDIEGDAELEARHGLSIPVLSIAGRPAFKGRLTAAEFERKLMRRSQAAGEGR